MDKNKLLGVMTVFGLLALNAKAQILEIYSPLNIDLVCQVQQGEFEPASTTNLTINTESLLTLIATDQGFTLPAKAKLWLADDRFYILKHDNTPFRMIDRDL